jgi:ubiquinol-cytochrome c reductase core subunit 2
LLTFLAYVLHEVVEDVLEGSHSKFLADPTAIATQGAHSLAFHRGLGAPLFSATSKPFHLHAEEIEAYGSAAYSKPNVALVGSGILSSELSKWTGEFFKDLPSAAPQGLPSLSGSPSKYFGGEERISSSKGNSLVIGFSGSSLANGSAYKAEVDVLATLLGGEAPVKWGSGTSLLAKAAASHGVSISTESAKYSDAGLLYITISGGAKNVAAAGKDVAAALKSLGSGSVAKESVQKAIAQAKFKAADAETGEAPSLDLVGLSAINGKILTPEEAIKGLSSISESAVSQVSHVPLLDWQILMGYRPQRSF